jgi:hypothetical protein
LHWLNGHTAKNVGNLYAAVNAINDIDCQLRPDVGGGLITSANSSGCDCHKAVSGLLRDTQLASAHRRAGKDSIASWNRTNSWRDTDLQQPATTPLMVDCPMKGQK